MTARVSTPAPSGSCGPQGSHQFPAVTIDFVLHLPPARSSCSRTLSATTLGRPRPRTSPDKTSPSLEQQAYVLLSGPFNLEPAMNIPPLPCTLVEDMGLRLEDTTSTRLLDVLLVGAPVLSGAAWVWAAVLGVGPDVLAVLRSPGGRLIAALVGVASVAAVIRAFFVWGWPGSEDDATLL